jgi:alpha-tubulin suppressor-like RCC1 family protein
MKGLKMLSLPVQHPVTTTWGNVVMPTLCVRAKKSLHGYHIRALMLGLVVVLLLASSSILAVPPTRPLIDRPQGSIVAWGHSPHYGEFIGTYTAIAAGDYHSLGLRADGSVVGWGTNYYGETTELQAEGSDFIGIAAGPYSSLGLRSDGSIAQAGRIADLGTVPGPNSDFIAIAVDSYHAVGLQADGSMQGWGCLICDPKFGCWDTGACDFPPPNTGFVAVAARWATSFGLKADGSIVWFTGGQSFVSPNSGFVAIAAADSHTLGLKSDGSVVAFDCFSSPDFAECNVPHPNSDFISIDAADKFSLGLKADGSIVAWGNKSTGQLNVPTSNAHFIAIAAGPFHSLAIRGSPADWDNNGRIDTTDHAVLGTIINSGDSGPDLMPTFRAWYLFDLDDDHDVDLHDFALFANAFTGE